MIEPVPVFKVLEGSLLPCPDCGSPDRTWEWQHPGVEAYCTIRCTKCGHTNRIGPI